MYKLGETCKGKEENLQKPADSCHILGINQPLIHFSLQLEISFEQGDQVLGEPSNKINGA